MELKPLISVIIPCYNQGQFLARALASVRAQKHSRVEIIIVNDGSTDKKTQKIIYDLKQQPQPDLKIFTIKNRGLAGARNFGLAKIHGNFIQFLDADDELLPKKFAKQLEHFQRRPNLDISYTKFIYQEHERREEPPLETLQLKLPAEDFANRWAVNLTIPPHAFLFKRQCFDRIRFLENFRSCEDWLAWCQLAATGHTFQLLNYLGAVYHQHEGNMSRRRAESYYFHALATAYLREHLVSLKNRAEFDQAATARLKYMFYQYFKSEFLTNNPDSQELKQIKSAKFFKVWQGYNAVLKKIGLKKMEA
jgi:glycosyltransferase involved in cell wall biosynthesis